MSRAPSSLSQIVVTTFDDARGLVSVLAKLFEISGALPRIEATESVYT